jgi:phosphopentomutase
MGVITPEPLRTYPDGFPPDIIDALHDATGRGILLNKPYNGVAAIEDYGEQHLRTGDLIVYTSADSVLQIAAHEDVVSIDELYEACAQAREIMSGDYTVGRVIARPFTGEPGHFQRTTRRKDLAVEPPGRSYLQELQDAGVPVHSVGKVASVFTGIGIDQAHPGATNPEAIASVDALIDSLDRGLVFANFVETDQVYGHRGDMEGFHGALQEIDRSVAGWLERLDPENDMLVLTADHGVDPTTPGTDHTREHVPLLAAFAGNGGRRHDGPLADVGASALHWLAGRDAPALPGSSFVE